MFHLQSLELLHWDYCQRVTLPLDGAIITLSRRKGVRGYQFVAG